jgi:hypothetical protein
MAAINEWMQTHFVVTAVVACVLFLVLHFVFQKSNAFPFNILLPILAGVAAIPFFIIFLYENEPVTVDQVMVFLGLYSVTLYIVLCDTLLHRRFARFLTRKIGENWVKGMDYIYLALGSAGILWSINRLEILDGRMSKSSDIFAPLLLATAVVIRFIKTRADIGGWNKLQ